MFFLILLHKKVQNNLRPLLKKSNLCSTLSTRNNSSFKCNYSNELEEAVNKQIESEKQAALFYLDVATKFLHPNISYIGAGGYFMKMYKEELGHMKKFINYQLIRGGTPNINAISLDSNMTLFNAFTLALKLEKNITEQLASLVCLAEKYHDHQCVEFITSTFLSEQMLAVNEIAQKIVHLHRLGDNKHALYDFDLQLAKCFPYTLSIK